MAFLRFVLARCIFVQNNVPGSLVSQFVKVASPVLLHFDNVEDCCALVNALKHLLEDVSVKLRLHVAHEVYPVPGLKGLDDVH